MPRVSSGGFRGALIGLWLARQLGLPEIFTIHIGNQSFPVVWSIIGSAVLLLIISVFIRGPRRRRAL